MQGYKERDFAYILWALLIIEKRFAITTIKRVEVNSWKVNVIEFILRIHFQLLVPMIMQKFEIVSVIENIAHVVDNNSNVSTTNFN